MNPLYIALVVIVVFVGLAYWARKETREKIRARMNQKYGTESIGEVLGSAHVSKDEKLVRALPRRYALAHTVGTLALGAGALVVFFVNLPVFAFMLIAFVVWRKLPWIADKIRRRRNP